MVGQLSRYTRTFPEGAPIGIASWGARHDDDPTRSHTASALRRATRRMSIGPPVVRLGAIAVLLVTILLASAEPASGATGQDAWGGIVAGAGSGTIRAPMRQLTDTPDPSTETDTADEASRVPPMVAVLNKQAVRSAGNLARVSAVAVPNLTLRAEFVVDARAERASAASAAMTAVAVAQAEAEAARSAKAALEAQTASDAAAAAELAAAQQADAEVAARTAQMAAVSATQEAQAAATREAEASMAAERARADALAAAAEASKRQLASRVAMFVFVLTVLAGGILGLRFWRNRKEPFVLKSIPVSVMANAHV